MNHLKSEELLNAAHAGGLETVRGLLDRGADPNLPEDRLWARPIAYAESGGHADVVDLLTQRGASA